MRAQLLLGACEIEPLLVGYLGYTLLITQRATALIASINVGGFTSVNTTQYAIG